MPVIYFSKFLAAFLKSLFSLLAARGDTFMNHKADECLLMNGSLRTWPVFKREFKRSTRLAISRSPPVFHRKSTSGSLMGKGAVGRTRGYSACAPQNGRLLPITKQADLMSSLNEKAKATLYKQRKRRLMKKHDSLKFLRRFFEIAKLLLGPEGTYFHFRNCWLVSYNCFTKKVLPVMKFKSNNHAEKEAHAL